jgi:hypothetical protein
MPLRDIRTKANQAGGAHKTAGQMTVQYRDTTGSTMNATVIGQGTNSGLKLQIRNSGAVRIIDDVPKATTVKSTGAYFSRLDLGGS